MLRVEWANKDAIYNIAVWYIEMDDDDDAKRKKKKKKVKCGWKGKKIVAAVDAACTYIYIHNNTAYNSNRIFCWGEWEVSLYFFVCIHIGMCFALHILIWI